MLGEIPIHCWLMRDIRYRRGKQESNDVDIVISHPDIKSGGDQVKGLCSLLTGRLCDKGTFAACILHPITVPSFRQVSLPMSCVST